MLTTHDETITTSMRLCMWIDENELDSSPEKQKPGGIVNSFVNKPVSKSRRWRGGVIEVQETGNGA